MNTAELYFVYVYVILKVSSLWSSWIYAPDIYMQFTHMEVSENGGYRPIIKNETALSDSPLQTIQKKIIEPYKN